MLLVASESLNRPEVKRWHRRMLERYSPPKAELAVILPCSARKPYSKSQSHALFGKSIQRGAGDKISLVHEVILTSPLGLVPRELERLYPAAHYDVPVTGHWSGEEKEIAIELLADYLRKSGAAAIAHVEGAYRDICGSLSLPMTPGGLSKQALSELEAAVQERLRDAQLPKKFDVELEGLRRVCDFQFGRGASEFLMPEGGVAKGNRISFQGQQIAAVNPQTGYLALTLAGAEMLRPYGKHLVELSFAPETNSIFSVGVEKADEEIRPGDEVIVLYGDKLVGVGKARLSGSEMERSKRGLAIELRHRA